MFVHRKLIGNKSGILNSIKHFIYCNYYDLQMKSGMLE